MFSTDIAPLTMGGQGTPLDQARRYLSSDDKVKPERQQSAISNQWTRKPGGPAMGR
jgi:hypothetical protein